MFTLDLIETLKITLYSLKHTPKTNYISNCQ